jgi:ASC-1-like (ASCH) protein
MEVKLLFGILSTAIACVCFIPYLIDIFKRKTQPHMYSWLIWTILQVVGVAAQLKDGAGYGAWALAVGAFFCFAIFLLSFKYGTKNISRFDLLCLIAAIVAIGVYVFIDNPIWATIVVAVIDFVGFLPTFRKGFQEPFSETSSTFILSAVANGLSIAALQNYSATTILYIGSLFFTNSSFATMILVRRSMQKGKKSKVHEMRLHLAPFEMIKNGTKTVEIRLNDEKRKLMKVGDHIEFTSRENPEDKFKAEITGLDLFKSFKESYSAYTPEQYGGQGKDEWELMYKYYSPEEEEKYGVLGIRLKRLP